MVSFYTFKNMEVYIENIDDHLDDPVYTDLPLTSELSNL